MYKTQLQQLCHQRRWSLPKYSATIDGPVNKPNFKASVYVNGLTFSSSDTFTNSKQAHNQAAKFALLNFTSPKPASLESTNECCSKQEVEASKHQQCPVTTISDTDSSSKLQLQKNDRKNDLDPSIYTNKTEGPPHKIHYKASVVIDGKSFETPTFFNTKEEADEAVAKILDMFQQDDSCPSTSLLQELTQKEGFSKPTYKTTQIGAPHMPTYFSTVEVEGVEFHGKASRSSVEAEQDAANIAYIALKECGLHMYAAFSSSNKGNQDNAKSKQKLNLENENELLDQETLHAKKKMKICNNDLPCVASMSKTPNTSRYLLCNRYKVYPCSPNIVFHEGIEVVPMGENKWVAASLDCPKHKDI